MHLFLTDHPGVGYSSPYYVLLLIATYSVYYHYLCGITKQNLLHTKSQ